MLWQWLNHGERLKRGSNSQAIECSVDQCWRRATILHRSKHYCDKHALELLKREAPDRSNKWIAVAALMLSLWGLAIAAIVALIRWM